MPDSLYLALYEKIRYRRGPIYRVRLDERSNVESLAQFASLCYNTERFGGERNAPIEIQTQGLDTWIMNKKFLSTIFLFAIFIGFLWWGLAMLFSPGKDAETVVYSLLLLVCAGYALVSILMLPRKNQP